MVHTCTSIAYVLKNHHLISSPASKGNYGDHGVPGVLEGTLEFAFDSSTQICGEYTLHYAGVAWCSRLPFCLGIVGGIVELLGSMPWKSPKFLESCVISP